MHHAIKEYVRKPQLVEAIQWNGDREMYKTLVQWTGGKVQRKDSNNKLWLDHSEHEEDITVELGDWIVRRGGRFFRVSDEKFGSLYEEVV